MHLVKKYQEEVVLANQIAQLKEHLVLEARLAGIIVRDHKVKLKDQSLLLLLVRRLMVNLSHRR